MTNQSRVVGAATVLEADPVADLAADRAAALARRRTSAAARAAIRRGSSTTTVPVAGDAGVEQRGGHARRLARAGRRAQHEAPAAA